MDAAVIAAMAKWPNVPAVYGWLSLTARGEWRLKGERVQHGGLAAFFGRNYGHDEQGRYFVQNGPQRIYVELQSAPYVVRRESEQWHRQPDGACLAADAAYLSAEGELFLQLDGELALLDDREWLDLANQLTDKAGQPLSEEAWDGLLHGRMQAFLALPAGRLALQPVVRAELLARFGVRLKPAE
jgi:hypothetical protein